MRALLVLAVLAPVAAAQTDAVDWIQAEIAPFEDEVVPLQAPIATTMTTRVSCALAEAVSQSVLVSYVVAQKPDWATVVVSPATDAAPVGDCSGGYAAPREARLTVTANDQAPAFVPSEIVVEVHAGVGPREQVDAASVALSAGYFAILDTQLGEPQAVIPPGGAHDFHIRVTNFGNGPTRLEPLLLNASPGLEIGLPPVTILGSKQQGASDVSADLPLRVGAIDESGSVNRVGFVNLHLVASYATDPSEGADESTVSVLVTVRSGAERESGSTLPLPGAGALALLGGAALVAALRGRRG